MQISQPLLLIMIFMFSFMSIYCGEKKSEEDANPSETESTETDNTSSISDTGSLGINEFDDIPNSVDPVLDLESDEDTQNFDAANGQIVISADLTQASSGVSLGEDTQSDYYDDINNPSHGSCEMVNRLRGILQEAAASDYAICDLSTFFSSQNDIESLYDGQDHIIEITEEGEIIERYKINVVKTGNKITSFTYHVCWEGNSQSLYVKKTVDSENNVEIFSKRVGSDNNGPRNITYRSQTKVLGTIDDDGEFVGLKTMDQIYSNDFNSDGTDVSYNRYKVIQSSKNMALNGYATQTGAQDQKYFAFFELVDDNDLDKPYDLKKLAIGAGALLYRDDDGAITQGWEANGSIDESSKWLSKVEGQEDQLFTPPVSESDQVDFSWSSAEDWDCEGEASLVIAEEDLDIDEDFEPCEVFELPQNQNMHLECHTYRNRDR